MSEFTPIPKMTFNIKIDAYFDWATPAESTEEQARREQANVIAAIEANRLNQSVQLILLNILENHCFKKF